MSNKIIKNKKALSQIIATILILIITIIAFSVLSIIIINTTKTVSLSPQLSCFNLKTKQILSIEKVCYNQQTHDIEISINRKIDEVKINEI